MEYKTLFFVMLAIVVASGVRKTYEDYKLYKVVPKTTMDVQILKDVQKSGIAEFWDDDFDINYSVKVMVAKHNKGAFKARMGSANIEVVEVIPNVQKAIDDQKKPANSFKRMAEIHLSMTWDRFYTLEEIYDWLDELEVNHPDTVTTIVMGMTNENRQIKGVKLNFHPERNGTKIGMIEGAIHAREWITPATVTWIIKEFLISNDPDVRAMAENYEWHIFPVANPDGYSYTFTDNRMWRKNRNTAYSTICDEGIDDDMSNGVDLNRNFGFQWMTVGATQDPCTNTFAGSAEFSEPESRAIAEYVQNLQSAGEFIYYLAFHSFSQLVVIPYSHVPDLSGLDVSNLNYGNMYEIGIRAAQKLEERFGTQYRVGISADIMYAMSGTSFDWVKNTTDIPVTYLFELRDTGEYGFLLPAEQIMPTGLEIMDFLVEMEKQTIIMGYSSPYSSTTNVVYSFVLIFSCSIIGMLN